jgi:hypothetical protein
MRCIVRHPLVLTPTLLGRDGVLRAYTLVAADRPSLTLDAWLAETAPDAPGRDRLIDGTTGPLPARGLVGLIAPTGCLFAVFAYAVVEEAADGPVLDVRGPSLSAPMGGRMVPEGIDSAIDRVAADLGCGQTRKRCW